MALWLALLCVGQAWGLFFTLEPKIERCIGISLMESMSFSGTYVFTGTHERNVIARVKSPQNFIMHQSPRGAREGVFELTSQDAGIHKLCFRTTDHVAKIISFHLEKKETQADELVITEEDMHPLTATLSAMGRRYDAVYRNVHFYQLRERTHRDLAEQTCDRILWCALVKVCILVVIALVQVKTMKGLLSSKSSQGV